MKTTLYLALDGMSPDRAFNIVRKTAHLLDGLKLNDLWDTQWNYPYLLKGLRDAWNKNPKTKGSVRALNLWADLKFHDTPGTVANRALQARLAGIDTATVHAQGGRKMIEAAVEYGPPRIFAVTLLTSLDDDDLPPGVNIQDEALRLAILAKSAGAHGVVCSAKEVGVLSQNPALDGMLFAVPGIRLPGDTEARGQVRMGSPDQAARDGANILVLGSTVTKAEDPIRNLQKVLNLVESQTAT